MAKSGNISAIFVSLLLLLSLLFLWLGLILSGNTIIIILTILFFIGVAGSIFGPKQPNYHESLQDLQKAVENKFETSEYIPVKERWTDPNPQENMCCKLEDVDEMDGYTFEKHMKSVFECLGYSVHHTPLTGDQGADLILTSNEGIRTAVQVKRYTGKVSNSAVQEVTAAKGMYKCTKGMVITNNYFTDSAIQLAKANGISLVDRDGLVKLLDATPQVVYQHEDIVQNLNIL